MPAPTHSPLRLPHSRITLVYNRQIVLGQGSYSRVLRGSYGDKEVAVKMIELKTSLTEDEFQHHKKLNHENVVELVAVLDDFNFRYIVLELCCGTLFQVIQKTCNGPELPTDREVMYQIADGLEYIHSQNLVHFDIKPKNILISLEGQMKLADFGLCKETIEGICILSGPIRGTFPWMAREVYPEDYTEGISVTVSPMADVFSCGCVFLVFLSREDGGIHPFGNWRSRETTQSNICKGKRDKDNINNLEHLPYANLILPMIENEPKNRGSLKELKKNLRDPAASSSIPNNTNTNTSYQAQQ